jgi:hypothetical protein
MNFSSVKKGTLVLITLLFIISLFVSGQFAEAQERKPCPDADLAALGYYESGAFCINNSGHDVRMIGGVADQGRKNEAVRMANETSTSLPDAIVTGAKAIAAIPTKVATDTLVIPVISMIGTILIGLATLILYLAATFFNASIEFSIYGFTEMANKIEAIDAGWKLFRDTVNMFLIFVLLYISIKTILGLGGDTKKFVVNVIIVALFINFSLFATRVVIDTSNVFAVGMHQNILKSMTVGGESLVDSDSWRVTKNLGVAGAIVKPLGLVTLFNLKQSGINQAQTERTWTQSIIGIGESALETTQSLIFLTIIGSVFILITAFVFFAAGIMFAIRSAVLILLMVVSPLAFGAYAFPGLSHHFTAWRNKLLTQAFFAPVFLFILYFVIYFINDKGFIESSRGEGLLLNFFIAIILLLSAILMTSKMGAVGGDWARKIAGTVSFGAAGYLGRNTLGRAGGALAESDFVKDKMRSPDAATRWVGRTLKSTGKMAHESSLDLRKAPAMDAAAKYAGGMGKVSSIASGGYKKMVSENEKTEVDRGKFIGTLTTEEKLREKQAKEEIKKVEASVPYTAKKVDIAQLEKDRKALETEVNDNITVIMNNAKTTADQKKAEAITERQRLRDFDDKLEAEKQALKGMTKLYDDEIAAIKKGAQERRKEYGRSLQNKTIWSALIGKDEGNKKAGERLESDEFDKKQQEEKNLASLASQLEKLKKESETVPEEDKPKT